jgi:hypothetical protein
MEKCVQKKINVMKAFLLLYRECLCFPVFKTVLEHVYRMCYVIMICGCTVSSICVTVLCILLALTAVECVLSCFIILLLSTI